MADAPRKARPTTGINERGYLFWFGYVCSIVLFLFVFVAFASPYWFKSWSRVHSPLANVGLWHICLSGWVKPRDPIMRSYVGCWWIHSTFFDDVWDQIMPPWFRAVQALVIFTLLCSMAAVFILTFYLFDNLKEKYFEPRKLKLFVITSVLMFGAGLLILITSLVFAFKAKDPNWMPRPWLSYFSFSFGLYVLAGFFAAFGGIAVFLKSTDVRYKKKVEKREGYPRKTLPPPPDPSTSSARGGKVGESFV